MVEEGGTGGYESTGHGDEASHAERLRRYYEDTWFEYRLLWLDRRTRALHFGYEQPGTHRHGASLLALNHVMAEHAGLKAGERVLDAGCGVGGTSMWLAEVYGAEVVGVNLVADHVERARRYVRERRLFDRVRFEVADYTRTGMQGGTFDVVWAQESACHAPDKAAFTAESHRLLRPGGRVVLAEYLAAPGPHGGDLRAWEDAWEMTLCSAAQWTEALTGTGFVDIRTDDVTDHMRRSLRRLRRLCLVLGPIAGALHAVKVRTETQQRNIAGSLAMWRALQSREWSYGIVTATRP